MTEIVVFEIKLTKQKPQDKKNTDFLKEIKEEIEEAGIGKIISAGGCYFEN